ncbi:MAG: hypothetical protein IKM28_04575 [Lachnospiraceae bacterium]|nr:hypothetical protein [Lachnospiraceae bacterium]
MEKEKIFAQSLEKLKQTGLIQGGCIDRSQLEEAFAKLELDENQLALIEEYLKKYKIGIDSPIEAEEELVKEEADYLAAYLKELKELETEAQRGELEAVTLSAMAGHHQAQHRLLELYLPKVVEIARLYCGQGVGLEDLIGEGNLALTRGVTMLGCLEQSDEVEGMLGKMIMDAMEVAIEENLQNIGQEQKLLEQVNQVAWEAKQLSETLCRKVTPQELAEETELSEEAILQAIRMSGDQIEGLTSPKLSGK